MHAAPVYISEMAPSEVRGLLVSLKEGFIVFGILMGFAIAALCDHVADSKVEWRIIWGLPLIVSTVIATGMFFMPPSPRWLLLQARTRTALPILPLQP